MRRLLQTGASAFVLLLIMFFGSLVLWVGTPVAWLWVGSRVQGSTGSLAAAVGAMLLGVAVTIAALVWLLIWLSNRYRASRIARGLEDTGHFALETVLALSAGTAIVGFGVWFFLFAGTSPIPLNISF
jgi:hypothetical protein